MSPPSERPSSHWGVFGVTQSGKTLELRRRLEVHDRWIVLDLDEEYDDLAGARVVDGVPELLEEIRRRARKRPSRWRVSFRAKSPAEYLGAIRAMWSLHRRLDLRTTLLVVEEAHRILEGRDLPEPYRQVLFRGLKRRLVVVTVSQNVQQLPTQVRQMSDRQVYFRIVGRVPRDVKGLLGDQADELPTLETLTPGFTAERGLHYVFHPSHLDDREQWRNL